MRRTPPAGIEVPAALRPWVASIHAMSLAPAVGVLTRPPDAATTLVLRAAADSRAHAVVLGPRTRASYHRADKDIPLALRIRLRPGCARAVLGRSLDELLDRVVPLEELWGGAGARLAVTLNLAPHGSERTVRSLERALGARIAALSTRDITQARLARAAAEELGSGQARVRDVAERLHVSERHLRASFRAAVGVSPKRFSRIQRVRGLLLHSEPRDLPRLSAEAGYCDQSHLTAEFRAAMGVTPGAFFAGARPSPSGC